MKPISEVVDYFSHHRPCISLCKTCAKVVEQGVETLPPGCRPRPRKLSTHYTPFSPTTTRRLHQFPHPLTTKTCSHTEFSQPVDKFTHKSPQPPTTKAKSATYNLWREECINPDLKWRTKKPNAAPKTFPHFPQTIYSNIGYSLSRSLHFLSPQRNYISYIRHVDNGRGKPLTGQKFTASSPEKIPSIPGKTASSPVHFQTLTRGAARRVRLTMVLRRKCGVVWGGGCVKWVGCVVGVRWDVRAAWCEV